MKGGVLGYGAILAIIITGAFVLIHSQQMAPVSATVATTEGMLTSFGNFNHFFLRTFNQSIEFISQRSAYDLGKSGGFPRGANLWNYYFPSIPTLEKRLKERIEITLPTSYKKGERIVTTDDIYLNLDPHVPLGGSRYFDVKGEANFSIYDESIRTRIFIHHNIDSRAYSSYFKLLNAGRIIFEEVKFNSTLNDLNNLLTLLMSDARFVDLDFEADVNGDIVTMVITEYCYPFDTYCLAPLTPEDHAVNEEFHEMGDVNWDGVIDFYDFMFLEVAYGSSIGDSNWNSACDFDDDGDVDNDDSQMMAAEFGKENPAYITVGGDNIPYDFVRLILKFKADQTGITPPSCDFDIIMNPPFDSVEAGDEQTAVVRVKNLGTEDDSVHLSVDSIVNSAGNPEPTITASFAPNDQNPTFNSIMTVGTSSLTFADDYTITVKGEGCGGTVTKTTTYTLTVSPSMTFIIDINPDSGTVVRGNSIQTFVDVHKIAGTDRIVDLFISDKNPPDPFNRITAAFAPNLNVPDFISTMTISTSPITLVGVYTITVMGVGGGSFDTDVYTLTVESPFAFNLFVTPASDSIYPTQGSTPTITVRRTQGTPEAVTVSLISILSTTSGLPDPTGNDYHITVNFANNPCTPSAPAYECYPSMSISTTDLTPPDTYEIKIGGNSATASDEVTFDLEVKTPECIPPDPSMCGAPPHVCKYWTCVNFQCIENNYNDGYDPAGQCGIENCNDKCDGGFEYRGGGTCTKTCDGAGNCKASCDPGACTYSTVKNCRWGCKNSLDCWGGIQCEQKTAVCREGLGACGADSPNQECTNDRYWSEPGPGSPKPIPSNNVLCETPACTFFGSSNGYSRVISDCSGCVFANDACSAPLGGDRECGCGGDNNCAGGGVKSGCWLVKCTTSTKSTYGCYDSGNFLNVKNTCTDGFTCVNGCNDYCAGNNKMGYICLVDKCTGPIGTPCPAATPTCKSGVCVV